MDSFLSNLADHGDHDSDGVFTVNQAKSRSKLADYQLASFELFPQFLVSAAVVSGSSSLSCEVTHRGLMRQEWTHFRFEGWSLPEEELELLFLRSLDSDLLKAQKYLTIAVSVLGSRFGKLDEVQIRSRSGDKTCLFRIENRELVQVKCGASDELPPHSLCVDVVANLEAMCSKSFSELAPWSSVPLSSGDSSFSCGFRAEERFFNSSGNLLRRGLQSPPVQLSEEFAKKTVEVQEHGTSPRFLALSLNSMETGPGSFQIIVDGVGYPAPPSLGLPLLGGFVVADHLQRDLSYQFLVQNQALLNLRSSIRQSVARLLAWVMDRAEPLPPQKATYYQELIAELSEDFDLSAIEQNLFRRTGQMIPTVDPKCLGLLQDKLPQASPKERAEFFARFPPLVRSCWRQNDLAKAQDLLLSAIRCREWVKEAGNYEMGLLSMTRRLLEESPEPAVSYSLIDEYLCELENWLSGEAFQVNQLQEGSLVHESWIRPLRLTELLETCGQDTARTDSEASLPEWFHLLGLLHQGKVTQALSLVRSVSLFCYRECAGPWSRFFLANYRGQLNWKTQVGLRASLSFSVFVQSEKTIAEKIDAVLFTRNSAGGNTIEDWLFSPTFWPQFYEFILSSKLDGKGHMRKNWRDLLLRILFDEVLQCSDGSDCLKLPLQMGPRSRP